MNNARLARPRDALCRPSSARAILIHSTRSILVLLEYIFLPSSHVMSCLRTSIYTESVEIRDDNVFELSRVPPKTT